MSSVNRKRLRQLRVALANRGMSMPDFARKLGLTPQAIHKWSSGQMQSRKITMHAQAMIHSEFKKMGIKES